MTRPGQFCLPIHHALFLALLSGTLLSACGSNESSPAGAGGIGATGGQGALGGTNALGGSSAIGGTAAGTAIGNGGTANTSGTAGAGGAGTGGAVGTAGSSAGGATNAGGGSGAGGATAGGTVGTAASSTGGTKNTGGSGTVGKTGAGGSSSGGTVATGGAIGTSGSSTGGLSAGGAGGTAGTAGGTSNRGGTATTSGGQGGSTGTANCANRAISLSANGTASDSDAANAHVEVDLKTDLPIGNSKRTIEFWAYIKTTDWVGEKNQVFYYGGSDATGSFGLDFGTNNVTGSTSNHATLNPFTGSAIRDDSGKDLGINSSTNQWVHIAMSWDGTVLTTYVNGLPKITAQGSGTTTTLNTAQSVIMIGCNPTNNNCFNGYFAEFRVWNIARTDAQIMDNYNKPVAGSEAGLVAYLKFDDATGATSAADAVTVTGHTAHNGTLKADTAAHDPTFLTPTPAVPLVCP